MSKELVKINKIFEELCPVGNHGKSKVIKIRAKHKGMVENIIGGSVSASRARYSAMRLNCDTKEGMERIDELERQWAGRHQRKG